MKKETIIKKIKSIIAKYGTFDIQESVNYYGSNTGLTELVEFVSKDDVTIVTYPCDDIDNEIDSYELDYKNLDTKVLIRLLELAEIHEIEMFKLEGTIKNNNY